MYRMVSKEFKDALIEVLFLLIFIGIDFLLVVLLAFFFGGGAEKKEFFDKIVFYLAVGTIGAVLIVAFKLSEPIIKSDRKLRNKVGWVNAVFHDPEDGIVDLSKHSFFNNPFKLYFGSLIFFSIFSFIMLTGFQTAFSDIPKFEIQQITKTAEIVLNVEPSALAETLMVGWFIGLLIGFFKFLVWKKNLPEWSYFFFSIVIIGVMGVLWLSYHNARYGSDEVASLFTLFFGMGGALLTVLTGSLLPWLAWHQTNNLFVIMGLVLSKEINIVVTAVIIIFSVLVFGIIMVSTLKSKGEVTAS